MEEPTLGNTQGLTGDTFQRMSDQSLYDRCLEETQQWRRRQQQDNRFCFELLRRAFDESQEAWLYAYSYCLERCRIFLYAHPSISLVDEPLDYLCNDVIVRIWRAKNQSFGDFNTLREFLQYLKRTAHNCVHDLLRGQGNRSVEQTEHLADPSATIFDLENVSEEFWQYLFDALSEIARDDGEAIRYPMLLELKYRLGYKNQEIVERFPELWSDTNTIRVDRQRIFRHLQGDTELRKWLEL